MNAIPSPRACAWETQDPWERTLDLLSRGGGEKGPPHSSPSLQVPYGEEEAACWSPVPVLLSSSPAAEARGAGRGPKKVASRTRCPSGVPRLNGPALPRRMREWLLHASATCRAGPPPRGSSGGSVGTQLTLRRTSRARACLFADARVAAVTCARWVTCRGVSRPRPRFPSAPLRPVFVPLLSFFWPPRAAAALFLLACGLRGGTPRARWRTTTAGGAAECGVFALE